MTTTAGAFDLSSSALIARPNTGCTPSPVKYPPETTNPLATSACPSTLAFTCSNPAKANLLQPGKGEKVGKRSLLRAKLLEGLLRKRRTDFQSCRFIRPLVAIVAGDSEAALGHPF